MRLIDADALIERIENNIKVIEYVEPQMAMGAIGVLNTIKKAPTEKLQLPPETSTTSKTETVDTDLISRQAAIELACWRCKKCERKDCEYKDSCETMSLLEALPSEDPKPPVEPKRPEIIRCKNCRHDNNCEIQYAAQAGSKFFCGAAERRGEK